MMASKASFYTRFTTVKNSNNFLVQTWDLNTISKGSDAIIQIVYTLNDSNSSQSYYIDEYILSQNSLLTVGPKEIKSSGNLQIENIKCDFNQSLIGICCIAQLYPHYFTKFSISQVNQLINFLGYSGFNFIQNPSRILNY